MLIVDKLRKIKNHARDYLGRRLINKKLRLDLPVFDRPKILVLGVYLANRKNSAVHIIKTFASSNNCSVCQKWVAIGDGVPWELKSVTLKVVPRAPKFEIMNDLISNFDVNEFDFILICDDDIYLPDNFIDVFIARQNFYKFDLAQPARTRVSFVDHSFVVANPFLLARETKFVEIGPLFSIAKNAYTLMFPFDMESPMGWGYDLVWPKIFEKNNLKMGIIDSTPIAHTMRPRGEAYSSDFETGRMSRYLAHNVHAMAKDAFVTKQKFWRFGNGEK